MGRRRLALVAVSALIVIVGGWALTRTNHSDPAPTTVGGVREPTCPMATPAARGGRHREAHPRRRPLSVSAH
ncbi:MAG: hypothetical protein QOJ56_5516 [Mycobacterium sp.]|nr:hypothetical protein [Mycobacterium sp.]